MRTQANYFSSSSLFYRLKQIIVMQWILVAVFASFILGCICYKYPDDTYLGGNVEISKENDTMKGVIYLGAQKVRIDGKIENPIISETTPKPEVIPRTLPNKLECRHCILFDLNLEASWCPSNETITCKGKYFKCGIRSAYLQTTSGKYVPYYYRGCVSNCESAQISNDPGKTLPFACTECNFNKCNSQPFVAVPEMIYKN